MLTLQLDKGDYTSSNSMKTVVHKQYFLSSHAADEKLLHPLFIWQRVLNNLHTLSEQMNRPESPGIRPRDNMHDPFPKDKELCD